MNFGSPFETRSRPLGKRFSNFRVVPKAAVQISLIYGIFVRMVDPLVFPISTVAEYALRTLN